MATAKPIGDEKSAPAPRPQASGPAQQQAKGKPQAPVFTDFASI